VQASQWLQRNGNLAGAARKQAAEGQNWDPSVQAMVLFPDLLKQLNRDITWTTDLGNAFLSQQAAVMDAVQRMRLKAQQAGKLSSGSQQTVTTSDASGPPIIQIEPANPQYMYVPQYDPAYIWGPALYYPYASWFYPPFAGGFYFGFGAGIPIGLYFGGGWGGWGGWGWNAGWGGHNIYVNNSFIHRYNFNAGRGGSLTGRSDWSHDAAHREGVPYATHALSARYGGAARQNLETRAAHQQAQSRGSNAESRGGNAESRGGNPQSRAGNPQAGGERMGNRQISHSSPSANRSAFGGVRQGAAVRTQSDHGFSSMGASRSGGGGGFHGGGGGGGRGGGGGGRR
jgi:hypothetical protein